MSLAVGKWPDSRACGKPCSTGARLATGSSVPSRTRSLAPPALVATRFVQMGDQHWCDLATGLRVDLLVGSACAGESVRDGGRVDLDSGTTDKGEPFVAVADGWPAWETDRDAGEEASVAIGECLDTPRDAPIAVRLEGPTRLVWPTLCRVGREASQRGVVPLRAGILSRLPQARLAVQDRSVLLLVDAGAEPDSGRVTALELAWLALWAREVVGAVGALGIVPTGAPPFAVALGLREPAPGVPERQEAVGYAGGFHAEAMVAARSVGERVTGACHSDPAVRAAAAEIARGDRLVGRGRPSAGERAYRGAFAITRRRDHLASWRGAAALRLGQLHLRRGRPADAAVWTRQAVGALLEASDARQAVRAACLAGVAMRRSGRLHEAAQVHATLLLGSRGTPDEKSLLVEAVHSWARLGRHQLVLRATEPRVERNAVVALPALAPFRMRALLAAGHLPEAGREASRLSELTRRENAAAHLHAALTWFHAAVGDAHSLDAHASAALAGTGLLDDAGRAEVRIAALRGARRLRARGLAGTQARALARLRGRADPDLRSQIDEVLGGRHRANATPMEEGGPAVLDEVLGLLQMCHDEDPADAPLEALCRRLRRQLGSLSVAVFAGGSLSRLASDGLHLPSPASAGRAFATGSPVPFEPVGHAVEAAVPIKHCGVPLGVIACRWPADAAIDLSRASALLAAGAASSLAVLVERRDEAQRPPEPVPDDLGLIGGSRAMDQVRALVSRAGMAPFPVLIEGESGTGKELIARAVHRVGPRRARRFCAVNCAALSDDLLEAELFGHARGAFTGAVAERAGLFEESDGGTLFLDEAAELSSRGQAKLLRVLQEGEVRRVGENLPRRVDVRVVAATNRPLHGEVAAGRYRADLRYRLDVIRICVPPLRDRREDIPLLAARFWADLTARTGRCARLDDSALATLARHHWPGNVRELQNVLAALAVQAPARGRVSAADLPEAIRAGRGSHRDATLGEARRLFERDYVRAALAEAGGRRGAAAQRLGLSRQGLAKLLTRLDIEPGARPQGVAPPRLVVSRVEDAAAGGARMGQGIP